MAGSPKLPVLTGVPSAVAAAIVSGVVRVPPLPVLPRPLKLDFAPNPARYPVKKNGGIAKAQPRKRAQVGVDLSPRLELTLSVE